MDRAPGLSVRLKLTLSYAGFLMLAGASLLAAVWVFLLRYVPEQALLVKPDTELHGVFPIRSNLLHVFAPRAAAVLAFLLVFGTRRRVASRRPDARPRDPHDRRRTRCRERVALPPNPASGPQR